MTLVWFILIFGMVVISHEFGHFLLAKVNGIHVVEFSVGMGPTIASFTKKDTKYSLKLLPIGGACMFEGEDGLNEKEGGDSTGSFLNANVWARISTVLAGPVFNFLLAFVIALIIVTNVGQYMVMTIGAVTEDSPAMEAGLQEGDLILGVNGERMYLYEELQIFTMTTDGSELRVEYERDGQKYEARLTPEYDESTGRYMMGVAFQDYMEVKGLDCVKYAWYEMRYNVKAVYKSLGMLFKGKVGKEDVAGPVGIAVNVVGKTYDAAKKISWRVVILSMLNITLMLSVNLGILNLLPIPALDGGRLVFLIIELIRGKPVPPEKEGMVHFAGMVFFMILMVFVFFNDLVNIFA